MVIPAISFLAPLKHQLKFTRRRSKLVHHVLHHSLARLPRRQSDVVLGHQQGNDVLHFHVCEILADAVVGACPVSSISRESKH